MVSTAVYSEELGFMHVTWVVRSYSSKQELVAIYIIMLYQLLSYDVASESEIAPCIKIDKPQVVYSFSRNVMTSIITLRTCT